MTAPTINHFYVTAVNGSRKHFVAGPYPDHATALDRVEAVRAHADEKDPRAWFMAWGTAGASAIIKTPLGAF
ncbi:hypothetical protein [Nitrospirillum iridis]|uniref:Uncharacterized protein n=1 Tax=Nitrospirillum iridis TaxID=765888 RepID=A0A7X0AZI8_9PROT|nr:hypothetical protein [Nitrospirillum iridis]MBB6253008.1 hypothetical protein [Nitrospirillum iridis]